MCLVCLVCHATRQDVIFAVVPAHLTSPRDFNALLVGIVANLIVRKYVKGYISHKLKVLVVHKTQPFPSLDSVVLVDE